MKPKTQSEKKNTPEENEKNQPHSNPDTWIGIYARLKFDEDEVEQLLQDQGIQQVVEETEDDLVELNKRIESKKKKGVDGEELLEFIQANLEDINKGLVKIEAYTKLQANTLKLDQLLREQQYIEAKLEELDDEIAHLEWEEKLKETNKKKYSIYIKELYKSEQDLPPDVMGMKLDLIEEFAENNITSYDEIADMPFLTRRNIEERLLEYHNERKRTTEFRIPATHLESSLSRFSRFQELTTLESKFIELSATEQVRLLDLLEEGINDVKTAQENPDEYNVTIVEISIENGFDPEYIEQNQLLEAITERRKDLEEKLAMVKEVEERQKLAKEIAAELKKELESPESALAKAQKIVHATSFDSEITRMNTKILESEQSKEVISLIDKTVEDRMLQLEEDWKEHAEDHIDYRIAEAARIAKKKVIEEMAGMEEFNSLSTDTSKKRGKMQDKKIASDIIGKIKIEIGGEIDITQDKIGLEKKDPSAHSVDPVQTSSAQEKTAKFADQLNRRLEQIKEGYEESIEVVEELESPEKQGGLLDALKTDVKLARLRSELDSLPPEEYEALKSALNKYDLLTSNDVDKLLSDKAFDISEKTKSTKASLEQSFRDINILFIQNNFQVAPTPTGMVVGFKDSNKYHSGIMGTDEVPETEVPETEVPTAVSQTLKSTDAIEKYVKEKSGEEWKGNVSLVATTHGVDDMKDIAQKTVLEQLDTEEETARVNEVKQQVIEDLANSVKQGEIKEELHEKRTDDVEDIAQQTILKELDNEEETAHADKDLATSIEQEVPTIPATKVPSEIETVKDIGTSIEEQLLNVDMSELENIEPEERKLLLSDMNTLVAVIREAIREELQADKPTNLTEAAASSSKSIEQEIPQILMESKTEEGVYEPKLATEKIIATTEDNPELHEKLLEIQSKQTREESNGKTTTDDIIDIAQETVLEKLDDEEKTKRINKVKQQAIEDLAINVEQGEIMEKLHKDKLEAPTISTTKGPSETELIEEIDTSIEEQIPEEQLFIVDPSKLENIEPEEKKSLLSDIDTLVAVIKEAIREELQVDKPESSKEATVSPSKLMEQEIPQILMEAKTKEGVYEPKLATEKIIAATEDNPELHKKLLEIQSKQIKPPTNVEIPAIITKEAQKKEENIPIVLDTAPITTIQEKKQDSPVQMYTRPTETPESNTIEIKQSKLLPEEEKNTKIWIDKPVEVAKKESITPTQTIRINQEEPRERAITRPYVRPETRPQDSGPPIKPPPNEPTTKKLDNDSGFKSGVVSVGDFRGRPNVMWDHKMDKISGTQQKETVGGALAGDLGGLSQIYQNITGKDPGPIEYETAEEWGSLGNPLNHRFRDSAWGGIAGKLAEVPILGLPFKLIYPPKTQFGSSFEKIMADVPPFGRGWEQILQELNLFPNLREKIKKNYPAWEKPLETTTPNSTELWNHNYKTAIENLGAGGVHLSNDEIKRIMGEHPLIVFEYENGQLKFDQSRHNLDKIGPDGLHRGRITQEFIDGITDKKSEFVNVTNEGINKNLIKETIELAQTLESEYDKEKFPFTINDLLKATHICHDLGLNVRSGDIRHPQYEEKFQIDGQEYSRVQDSNFGNIMKSQFTWYNPENPNQRGIVINEETFTLESAHELLKKYNLFFTYQTLKDGVPRVTALMQGNLYEPDIESRAESQNIRQLAKNILQRRNTPQETINKVLAKEGITDEQIQLLREELTLLNRVQNTREVDSYRRNIESALLPFTSPDGSIKENYGWIWDPKEQKHFIHNTKVDSNGNRVRNKFFAKGPQAIGISGLLGDAKLAREWLQKTAADVAGTESALKKQYSLVDDYYNLIGVAQRYKEKAKLSSTFWGDTKIWTQRLGKTIMGLSLAGSFLAGTPIWAGLFFLTAGLQAPAIYAMQHREKLMGARKKAAGAQLSTLFGQRGTFEALLKGPISRPEYAQIADIYTGLEGATEGIASEPIPKGAYPGGDTAIKLWSSIFGEKGLVSQGIEKMK